MPEIKAQVDNVTFEVFERAVKIAGLTKEGSVSYALDAFAKLHLDQLKLSLQVELFCIQKLKDGQSLREANDAAIEEFGENEFTKNVQANSRFHLFYKKLMDKTAAGEGTREGTLGDSLRIRANEIETSTLVLLTYIEKL